MLAVCGGGSNTVALAVVLGAALVWLLIAFLAIRTGRDRQEKALLIGLLVLSVLIGPTVYFGIADGFSGGGDDLGSFILALLLPGAIGAGIALATQKGRAFRALFISSWGALFLTGGFYVLLIAVLGFGTACLD
jgi:hypothetical protein